MKGIDRRRRTAEIVRAQGSVTVIELVREFGLSEATIRRDLLKLDQEGLLRRTHGGARLAGPPDEEYASMVDQHGDAKEAIALAALDEVQDGQSVLLDIGTTVFRVARHLHGRPITVLTRNLAVYAELWEDECLDLVLLGGLVKPHHRSLTGYLTEEGLRQVRADVLLMGTSGVSRTGQSVDTEISEVSVKRAMMAAADRVVLLADSSKFPGRGTATVCDSSSLACVITDRRPQDCIAAALTRGGAEIRVSSPLVPAVTGPEQSREEPVRRTIAEPAPTSSRTALKPARPPSAPSS